MLVDELPLQVVVIPLFLSLNLQFIASLLNNLRIVLILRLFHLRPLNFDDIKQQIVSYVLILVSEQL